MSTEEFSLTHPTVVAGRSGGDELDYYPTPRWCVLALLRHADLWLPAEPSVLDPACGEGAILDAVRDEIPGADLWGIELHEGRAARAVSQRRQVVQGNGLELDWGVPDLVLGNPPYTLANEFAWKAAAWAAEHQTTAAMLLRLSFLEPASGRAVLFAQHPPDVYVLPRRPAFDGRGTDNITSAWFVWPGSGRIVWLPP